MSLRDQLLQSGVASKKQHQMARTQRKKQAGKKGGQHSADDAYAQKRQEQIKRDKELNAQREQARRQSEVQAQIRQILDSGAVPREPGDIHYRFVHEAKVKTLYLSEEQYARLLEGRLALAVRASDHYTLVSTDTAEKLLQRDPSCIVVNNRRQKSEVSSAGTENSTVAEKTDAHTTGSATEDPYAAYAIPDDLMW